MGWFSAVVKIVFDNPLGKIAATGVLLAGLIGWFAVEQRSIGRAKERAEITKVNADAAKLGAVAARKSGDRGVRGKLDPSTRDD